MRRRFQELLTEEMRKNEDIVLLVGDVGYKVFDHLREDYPDRVINPGAAEQLMIGMGAGLAMEGKIPVCYSITPLYCTVRLSSLGITCTTNRSLLNWLVVVVMMTMDLVGSLTTLVRTQRCWRHFLVLRHSGHRQRKMLTLKSSCIQENHLTLTLDDEYFIHWKPWQSRTGDDSSFRKRPHSAIC